MSSPNRLRIIRNFHLTQTTDLELLSASAGAKVIAADMFARRQGNAGSTVTLTTKPTMLSGLESNPSTPGTSRQLVMFHANMLA
jgi:hypothetical protein